MKRRWLAAIFSCWLWAGAAHAAEAPLKFLLAYGAIGGNAVPLWIAKEQGIFRKYNLEPQLIYIIAGRAMQSMLAGDIQFGLLGATHVTNAVTAGGDMTMLLGMEDKLNYFLNVRPGIKSRRRFERQESGYRHSVRLPRAGDLRGPGPSGPGAAARPYHALEYRQHTGAYVRFVRRWHRRRVFQSGGGADRGATGVSGTVRSGQSECPVSIIGLGHIAKIYALPIRKSSRTSPRRLSKASPLCKIQRIRKLSSTVSRGIYGSIAPIVWNAPIRRSPNPFRANHARVCPASHRF